VYCVTGRLPDAIPLRTDPLSRTADPAYDEKLQALRSQLATTPAVVVLLTTADGAELYPPPSELAQRLGVRLVSTANDGQLYTPG
jgi:hypothetical protein